MSIETWYDYYNDIDSYVVRVMKCVTPAIDLICGGTYVDLAVYCSYLMGRNMWLFGYNILLGMICSSGGYITD